MYEAAGSVIDYGYAVRNKTKNIWIPQRLCEGGLYCRKYFQSGLYRLVYTW